MSELRLQVLGPLRLWRGDAELDAGPHQQACLLALLLARVGRPVGTGELIDLIWGVDAPSSALNILHKYVSGIRRTLEPDLPARESGSYLHRRGNAYLFTADAATLDLAAFRALAADRRYAEAIALWRGPAGDGLAGGTAATAVFAALDDEFYDACTAAADRAVAAGRPEPVLPALHLAASMAPFHEPVQAALITALGAAGRQAEALAVFQTVRERLAGELGIDPGPVLARAHRRVLTAAPVPATVVPAASGLVGRAAELAVLRTVVDGALSGRTAIGVVEGEPGAGKSRLLREAATIAGRGDALVVWGSCLEGDGTPSMWPWEQALTAVVATLPAPEREKWLAGDLGGILHPREDSSRRVPDGDAQFRLFEAVVDLVGQTSARRPLVLILDDLQWADVASLQLFGHLAGRLPAGTAIIGALRDRAPTVSAPLAQVLAAAGRMPGHRRIRLGPLAAGDVAELVRHEAGHDPGEAVTRAIHARTAGNPFFVRELSRFLSEAGALADTGGAGNGTAGTSDAGSTVPVPSTVRDVVRDRMSVLDEQARDLLTVAAVIGREIDLRLLSRATGVDVADCLERLEPLHALGLLEPGADGPSSVRFAHDLVRESVTETTAQPRAARIHLSVADALEHSHADDEVVAERLAYHLWESGPLAEPGRTAGALIRAGRCAATKLAFDAAGRQLRSAVQVTRTAGLMDLELSALTLLAIVVRRQSGYDESTFGLLDRAEYLARATGREAEAADFLFIRLMGAYTSIERDRGRLARRMYEMGRSSTDPAVRRYGRQSWGLHQWDVGDIGAAFTIFNGEDPGGTDVETPLRQDGGIPGEGPGWRAVTTALHGDVDSALAQVDTWDAPGDPFAASVWVYYTSMIAAMAGDAALARRAAERWVSAGLDRLRTRIDDYIRQNWCWARALTGDPAAAAEAEALIVSLTDPPGWGLAHHWGLIGEMWLATGDPERAAIALDRADQALWDHGQRWSEGLLLLLRADLLAARGEPREVVRDAARRARDRSAATGAHLFARRAEQFLEELA